MDSNEEVVHMRERDLALIGRLPEYQIPVYWDAASERFIKVSPYPPGSVDKDRKPIPGKLVWDEYGRQIPAEDFVRKIQKQAMHRATVMLIVICAVGLGYILGRWGMSELPPSKFLAIPALVAGIVLGLWANRWVTKKSYTGFVMPASPREVAAAAREGGVDSVRGFQYHLGSLPMTISFVICFSGVPASLLIDFCLSDSAVKVLAFPFLGALMFLGVGIIWFAFFSDRFDSWRHRHRDASEVRGM